MIFVARNLRLELKALLHRYAVMNRGSVEDDALAREMAQCLKAFDQKHQEIRDPYRVSGPSPE